MKKLPSVATALAIGLLASLTATAEGFMPWTSAIDKADLNGDGMLTMFEVERFKPVTEFPGFQPFMADHFKDLDANQDGMVDRAELERAKELFGMTDAQMSEAFFKTQGFMPRNP
ncbi:MAG: hypothetical protein AB7Q81_04885 [Gammaproteobacteria bacterium]